MVENFAKEDMETILFDKDQIDKRVKELAKQISDDYRDKNPIFIGVLRGSVIFYTDLVKNLDIHIEMNFLGISSYGNSTESSGEVRIQYDMQESIKGRHVVIIEDIIDTGLTLEHLVEIFKAREPESIRICSLLDKPSRRKANVKGDYIGFEVPNEFVVGYGLDYAGKYRNLQYIGVLKPEIYA